MCGMSGTTDFRRRVKVSISASFGLHLILLLFWGIHPERGLPREWHLDNRVDLGKRSRPIGLIDTGSEEPSEFPTQIRVVTDNGNHHPLKGHQAPVVQWPAPLEKPSGGKGEASKTPLRFFGATVAAGKIVYVIDRSISMGFSGALSRAVQELSHNLTNLPPTAHFQVILYNQKASPLWLQSDDNLLPATPPWIEKAQLKIRNVLGKGGTDHVEALKMALRYHPDAIYFVTDAEDLTESEIRLVTKYNREHGQSAIHAIDLTGRGQPTAMLRLLATENNGTYQQIPPSLSTPEPN